MTAHRGASSSLLLLILVLIAILVALAALQYRWIAQASDAAEERMRANMEFAARHFAYDVDRELLRVVNAFEPMRPGSSSVEIAAMSDAAVRGGRSHVLESVYVVRATESDLEIEKLTQGRLVPAEWPMKLSAIYERLAEARDPGAPAAARDVAPLLTSDAAMLIPVTTLTFGESSAPREGAIVAAIVQLNRGFLSDGLFPALARRYFATNVDDELDVAVVAGGKVIYRSDPAWPDRSSKPELEMPLVLLRVPESGLSSEPVTQGAASSGGDTGWYLLVRLHGGTLADVVTAIRRRNLAISSGILALLAGSVVLLGLLLRRAERLRHQQLQFVASVTHELNTPLAALSAAGQNLADGIVTDPVQIARYGSVIVRESGRLRDMVAEVLEFAGLQARRSPREHTPVDVSSLVAEAVEQSSWIAETAGVRIEMNVAQRTRPADGDATALTRALRNLVANAVRHGGSGGWVGVTARDEGECVAVIVEDLGPGIAPRDLPHLFEPFYRGRGSASVAGSGLGLAIAQRIAQNHGGSVTVERARDRGASFTLRIPAHDSVRRDGAAEGSNGADDGAVNTTANPARRG